MLDGVSTQDSHSGWFLDMLDGQFLEFTFQGKYTIHSLQVCRPRKRGRECIRRCGAQLYLQHALTIGNGPDKAMFKFQGGSLDSDLFEDIGSPFAVPGKLTQACLCVVHARAQAPTLKSRTAALNGVYASCLK